MYIDGVGVVGVRNFTSLILTPPYILMDSITWLNPVSALRIDQIVLIITGPSYLLGFNFDNKIVRMFITSSIRYIQVSHFKRAPKRQLKITGSDHCCGATN